MTFLGAPLSTLLLAGAAVSATLLSLYLLRPQRRRIDVPYARLWGLIARETRASSIARRLRRWESLLLQLVIACLILLALADPRFGSSGARPRHLFLVDTSASMQARDQTGGRTRLELAREALERAILRLEPDEEAMVVGFDTSARALSSLTSDEAELRDAARALAASDAPDAIVPALRFAADALAGAGRSRLTLISDGALDTSRVAATTLGTSAGALDLEHVDLRYLPVGPPATNVGQPSSENVAITGFSVRRYPANPSAYELLIELRSDSARPRRAQLNITQEDEPVESVAIELAPHAVVQRRIVDLSGEGRRLEARIEVEGGDPLPLDDRAYAVLPERARTRVLLVGAGNLYTEGALLLDRAVEVVRKQPTEYATTDPAAFDVLVFDGFVPARPPARPALYLGCPPPGCPLTSRGVLTAPIVTETTREHPIMRWVALKDLNVSVSHSFATQPGDVALASSLGRPILVAGERAGQRLVALGFRPAGSDLPLRVAFPVLLVNSIKWLVGSSLESTSSVRTGHAERISAAGEALRLRSPRGADLVLAVREGRAELLAREAGFYATADELPPGLIAANLVNARESELGARPLTIAGKPLDEAPAATGLRPRAALWRWLTLLALCFVLLEWWTYHRRWTV